MCSPPLSLSFQFPLTDPSLNHTITPHNATQRSWSGDKFTNKDWALKHGDGKAYIK